MGDSDGPHAQRDGLVSRRDVMAALVRAGLGGLLVVGTGFLVARAEDGPCARGGVCDGCPAQGGCSLAPRRLPRGRESDGR